MNREAERIAIVGAGAMGVVMAYHFRLANIDLDFLVRPARAATMPNLFRLYAYDDGSTPTLDGFGVLSRAAELSTRDYAFVLLTLDGADLSGDEGRTLLADIGTAVMDRPTTLIVGSVGIGLRDSVIATTGLPPERVVSGRLALLGHKVAGVSLPLHAPTRAVVLTACDFAFRHLNEGGFSLEDRNSASHRFAALFDRCGIAKCFLVPPEVFALQSRAMFPLFAASELLGWPPADGLANGGEIWERAIEAVREIQGLSDHGEAGRRAAAETNGESLLKMWRALEAASLPLDWQAFNAHQHGSKVKKADKLLLAGCVEQGRKEGKDMQAVQEILSRWS